MEINLLFFLCVVPAIILYGIAKSGLGGSMTLISIPLMTVVMPLGQALAIVLPILILSDMVAVYRFLMRACQANARRVPPNTFGKSSRAGRPVPAWRKPPALLTCPSRVYMLPMDLRCRLHSLRYSIASSSVPTRIPVLNTRQNIVSL